MTLFKLIPPLLITLIGWFLAKVFYPFVYPFRSWARKRVYKLDEEFIVNTVHADEGMNKTPYRVLPKQNKNIIDWIARFIWWFLDDTPEWSDAGGTSFVREDCNNDTGISPKSYGSYVVFREETEKYIYNRWRRFYCAYRWSALKNQLVNFNREYIKVHKYIKGYEVLINTTEQKIPVGKFTEIKPIGTRYKGDSRNVFGTQAYYVVAEDGSRYPCIESAGTIGNIYYDFWIGYLRGTLRFESAFRYGFIKE